MPNRVRRAGPFPPRSDGAIAGCDDMPMATLVHPGLTTVRQPVREPATTTARLLHAPLTRKDGDTVLDTEPVLHGSCGCPDGATRPTGHTGGDG